MDAHTVSVYSRIQRGNKSTDKDEKGHKHVHVQSPRGLFARVFMYITRIAP